MATITDRLKNLPPERVEELLRQLRPKLAPAQRVSTKRLFRKDDGNFSLVSGRPGILDSLSFRVRPRYSTETDDPAYFIRPQDLEIEVFAASLNFRDVAVALGMYPATEGPFKPQLGCDAAGIVTAVGSQVERFSPGDAVICLSPRGTFARYTWATQNEVFLKPPDMSFEQASGLPLAFLTAYYALVGPGRLRTGEKILIHSAAGGVGLAALQIAQMIGAEVLATAGTDLKRDYLHSLGIKHVMDSRALHWPAEVLEHTSARGVDVVLNSLAAEGVTESLKVLAMDGRLVELGKRDFVPGRSLPLEHFGRGLSFVAMDISQLVLLRTDYIRELINELSGHFHSGRLRPLPCEVYPASRLIEAFRHMAEGKHIGKIAITMRDQAILVDDSSSQP